MGSSMKRKLDGIIEHSKSEEYKELSYKLFQLHDYHVKSSNGEFKCPFCPSKDDDGSDYTHLLQHAIRMADDSITLKQRIQHFTMARYLDVDLANEVKADPQILCFIEYVERELVSDAQWQLLKLAITEKREKEALDKVRELERQMKDMRDEMDALIISKERLSNELQRGRVRR